MLSEMQQQNESQNMCSAPELLASLRFPQTAGSINPMRPTLNKILAGKQGFLCGYSNGMLLQYTYPAKQSADEGGNMLNEGKLLKEVHNPYQNVDVIDMARFSKHQVVLCTHTEVTLLNLEKKKRLSLKGHEQTPMAVSAHPVSPLVVSVSNLVIQHDLRCQKPILVNYVTPPVYDIQFFADGQFYFLSGEPCRVGKDKWMRTLENGIGVVSNNSKFVLTNDMNSKLTLWDWKKSQKIRQLTVKNQQNYQYVHFGMDSDNLSRVLFAEDDGHLVSHDLLSNSSRRFRLFEPTASENWKSAVCSESATTRYLLMYQHTSTKIKCYSI